MRIVIFGTGLFYERRKIKIKTLPEVEIIAFIDNNTKLWGKQIEGKKIYNPAAVCELDFDYVILMSLKAEEMWEQLCATGLEAEKIIMYEEFCAGYDTGEIQEPYMVEQSSISNRGSILIAMPEIKYTGVSIVARYMAEIYQKQNYDAAMVALEGEEEAIKYLVKQGIRVFLYNKLFYAKAEELQWLGGYDKIIVNDVFLLNFAVEANKLKETIFYLHEPESLCKLAKFRYRNLAESEVRKLKIYAVSNVAKRAFTMFYPDTKISLLPYGIPDESKGMDHFEKTSDKVIFAIIGCASEIKGHDIFVEAIERLKEEELSNCEFWIIGDCSGQAFGTLVKEAAKKIANIKIYGVLNREELQKKYQEIDVVVNPSREDSLPVVVAEGLMHGKICITSDATGMRDFISNGKNGLICKKEDSIDLHKQLQWVLEHPDKMGELRKNARETYARDFSLLSFEERLKKIIS